MRPLGLLRTALTSDVTLVTTAECLADPVPLDLTKAYEGHPFMYLGPLLDEPGAKRAGGHKFDSQRDHMDDEKPLALARAAKAEGRKVVLVSLGTIITGDHSDSRLSNCCATSRLYTQVPGVYNKHIYKYI